MNEQLRLLILRDSSSNISRLHSMSVGRVARSFPAALAAHLPPCGTTCWFGIDRLLPFSTFWLIFEPADILLQKTDIVNILCLRLCEHVDQVEQQFKTLVEEICQHQEREIIAMEVMPDHVHLFLNALPTDSPADIMAKIKGITSRRLRQHFKHLSHMPSLWTRSYFVSTAVQVSSEPIRRYVEAQKKRG